MVALFFGTWYVLSTVDWMALFRVEKVSSATEQKLGELFWDIFRESGTELDSVKTKAVLDSLLTNITKSNGIDYKKVKLHLLQNEEINAFVLPDNHLVVYTGLLTATKNHAELAGVLCHELAHIENNHVMKKLVKEVGLSVLLSMISGNTGSEVARETAKLLSSTAYDRKLETEADRAAVDYMLTANIDPIPFAEFLSRLSETDPTLPGQLYWISTHPDSKERALALKDYIENRRSQ